MSKRSNNKRLKRLKLSQNVNDYHTGEPNQFFDNNNDYQLGIKSSQMRIKIGDRFYN
jgi:hypothetical protein